MKVISPLYRNNDRIIEDAARGATRLSDSGSSGRFHLNLKNRFGGLQLNGADVGGLDVAPQERWQGERKPMMGLSIKQRF